MTAIPKYIDEALDTVDAAIFTGDCFDNNPDRLNELEKYIERWAREIETKRFAIERDKLCLLENLLVRKLIGSINTIDHYWINND